MTPRQKRFCEYYIQSGNAAEAARKAGYSPKTADAIGRENLRKPTISAYIHERMGEQDKELVADSDEVLRFYSAVMRGEIKDQFGLEASLADRLKAGDSLMKRYAAALSDEKTRAEIAKLRGEQAKKEVHPLVSDLMAAVKRNQGAGNAE